VGMSGTRGVRRSSFLPHTIPNRSDRRRRSFSSSCRINHSDDIVLTLSRGRVVAFSELEGCAREQARTTGVETAATLRFQEKHRAHIGLRKSFSSF
jgi:hypothetical protein